MTTAKTLNNRYLKAGLDYHFKDIFRIFRVEIEAVSSALGSALKNLRELLLISEKPSQAHETLSTLTHSQRWTGLAEASFILRGAR